MNVLLADDDLIPRRILHQSLRSSSYDVVSVSNGREALEAMARQHFSLVITDWAMPEVDGLELIRRIRASNHHGYVYIVLLTGRSDTADVVAGLEAGADDFMTKPFDHRELKARLHAAQRVLALEQRLAQQNEALQAASERLLASNERMRKDQLTAAKVQQALLPQAGFQFPGLDVAWSFQPCEELAGDIFNVVPLSERHLGVYVLDVSSHGVAAALLAVTLSRLLSGSLHQSSLLKQTVPDAPGFRLSSPAEVAAALNRQFPMDPDTGQYFTLLYGVLHQPTGTFTFTQAGHPKPIAVSASGVQLPCPDACGPAVGFIEEAEYSNSVLTLEPGDRLFVFSDGLPEARNLRGEMFGEGRLESALRRARGLALDSALSAVVEQVASWSAGGSFADDVSILGVELIGSRLAGE